MSIGHGSVSIISVPTEIGANQSGVSLSPHVLRVNGLCQKLVGLGFEVKEIDDISGSGNSSHLETGLQKLGRAVTWYQSVKDNVYRSLQSASFPLIIGGDHSVSIGSIAAVSKYCEEINQPLSVLWFDAHTDFNTFDTTPSGNIHGMPAAVIAGLGHPDLLAIGHKVPLVEPENIYQVGVRSVDAVEKRLISESDIQVFDMRFIDDTGVHRIMDHILDEVQKKGACLHVSFDIDCLDPSIAPGTTTKSPGGLTYREAQLCMEMIHDSDLMKSLDIVELNPLLDVHNQTGIVTVELIESLFGKEILSMENRNKQSERRDVHTKSINGTDEAFQRA